MQADIAALRKKLEDRLLKMYNCQKLSEVFDDHEYLNVHSMDGSILEYCLGNPAVYTRIVWSKEKPNKFQFSTYTSKDYPLKPKTEFYLDQSYECESLTITELEERVLGK